MTQDLRVSNIIVLFITMALTLTLTLTLTHRRYANDCPVMTSLG